MRGLEELFTASTPLLVLAPHPDDEILGCAHLMQQASAAGCPLIIVWLTDGGASHGQLTPDAVHALVERRRAEAGEGLEALGISPIATYHLGYPDGGLARHAEHAKKEIDEICRRHVIGTVVVTDGGDNHPDHRAAYAVALALERHLRVLSYPVSTRFDGLDYAPPPNALRLKPTQADAKRKALFSHRSQMEAAAICPMTPATIDQFCADAEYFIPVERNEP